MVGHKKKKECIGTAEMLLNEGFDLFFVFDSVPNLAPTIQDGNFVALHHLPLILFLCYSFHYPQGRKEREDVSDHEGSFMFEGQRR